MSNAQSFRVVLPLKELRRLLRPSHPLEKKNPAAELSARHLDSARLLPCRNDLYRLLPKNAVVAELGVAWGDNAKQIWELAQPREFHLVDLWPDWCAAGYEAVQNHFADPIARREVFVHRQDDLDVLRGFPDQTLDWVYLDSSHQYDHTWKELEILRSKVKKGGMICGHDYVNYDPHLKTQSEWNWYLLKQCIHEFCQTYDWEIAFLTMECWDNPSFALKALG